MLRNKDINDYGSHRTKMNTTAADNGFAVAAGATVKTMFGMVWKLFWTIFSILVVAGIAVLVSIGSYVYSLRNESIASLSSIKLNESSTVYITDSNGNTKEYMKFHANENRSWVDFKDIPQAMKDAMVAIEDKRFYEHDGVDWKTTLGAAYKLATGQGGAGGSTLTQQLIKNVTNDNEVSITRKLREIFSALNLEKEYTKDEILEFYLNYVYYGSGCHGIQSAAQTYFGKDIWDCSIAECASIAGITQNPYAYTPVLYPESNKKRQQIVLNEMYDQGYISKAEYDEAMEESEHMKWAFGVSKTGGEEEEEEDDTDTWNWYIETMYYDMITQISESLNISRELAADRITNGGLEIYSCLDVPLQTEMERIFTEDSYSLISDNSVQFGFFMMDYNGKVLAVVGNRNEKTGNLWLNRATQSQRQAGSSFKPISTYSTALDLGAITYGTVLKDQPIEGYFDDGKPGPNNFSMYFTQYMNVDQAIEMSQNAPAAQLCKTISPATCYQFLTERLNFTSLDAANDQYSLSAMAIGGLYNGVTVREMTAAFQIFGNGGRYYKPYTFYYIKDSDGNIICDNRNNSYIQALSEDNATVMNRLLQNVVYGYNGTGYQTQIDGWRIYGKTGTTDSVSDTWFIGGTPICVAGCWCGYDTPSTLSIDTAAKTMWRQCMKYMTDNFGYNYSSDFDYSDTVQALTFCRDSGCLASASCYNVATGYYSSSNIPRYCNGGTDHTEHGRSTTASEDFTINDIPATNPNDNGGNVGYDDNTDYYGGGGNNYGGDDYGVGGGDDYGTGNGDDYGGGDDFNTGGDDSYGGGDDSGNVDVGDIDIGGGENVIVG